MSFIAAFPNWDADARGATFANKDGIFLRNAWEKFGTWAPGAQITTADGTTTTAKVPKDYSLTGDEFNAALTHWWRSDGPMPFGQPFTALIDSSTFKVFGHGDACPWLTMHTVGNKPRNHAIYASLEEIFALMPASTPSRTSSPTTPAGTT